MKYPSEWIYLILVTWWLQKDIISKKTNQYCIYISVIWLYILVCLSCHYLTRSRILIKANSENVDIFFLFVEGYYQPAFIAQFQFKQKQFIYKHIIIYHIWENQNLKYLQIYHFIDKSRNVGTLPYILDRVWVIIGSSQ